MSQFVIRLLFLLVNVVGNVYILSFYRGAESGNDILAVVIFNAVMVLAVYIVDFIIVKVQRLLIDIEIGEHFTNDRKW